MIELWLDTHFMIVSAVVNSYETALIWSAANHFDCNILTLWAINFNLFLFAF